MTTNRPIQPPFSGVTAGADVHSARRHRGEHNAPGADYRRVEMTRNYDLERAIANDDHLDWRRAGRAAGCGQDHDRCQILFHYEERCDQCARRTWKPHVTAGWTFCRRCCPACARVDRLGKRAS